MLSYLPGHGEFKNICFVFIAQRVMMFICVLFIMWGRRNLAESVYFTGVISSSVAQHSLNKIFLYIIHQGGALPIPNLS